nr:hypothetical protein [Acetobacter pasteurianus]
MPHPYPMQAQGARAVTHPPHGGGYTPAPPDIQDLFAARREGVALTAQDMPPNMEAQVQACWQRVQLAMQPVSQPIVAAWLKKAGAVGFQPTGGGRCRSAVPRHL